MMTTEYVNRIHHSFSLPTKAATHTHTHKCIHVYNDQQSNRTWVDYTDLNCGKMVTTVQYSTMNFM